MVLLFTITRQNKSLSFKSVFFFHMHLLLYCIAFKIHLLTTVCMHLPLELWGITFTKSNWLLRQCYSIFKYIEL